MARTDSPMAPARAALIEAGCHALAGDARATEATLRRAVEVADAWDLEAYAASARWFLGERVPGREGQEFRAGATGWGERQRVRNVARFAAGMAPGVSLSAVK